MTSNGKRAQATSRRSSRVTRIALLTANPDDRDGLKTALEHRAIRAVLRSSLHRDEFELTVRSAARPSDLLEALCEDRAAILHFSGHGAADAIALEDSTGLTAVFPADALREAIATAGTLRMVVLAACHSAAVATSLVDVVDCAIGVDGAMTDAGMRAFAEAFYRAIFAGLTMANAFGQGQAAATAASPPDGDRLRLCLRAAASAGVTFCGPASQQARRRTAPRARAARATGDSALLAKVKSLRNLEWELPERLESHLAEVFPQTDTIGNLINEATRMCRQARPDETCIHRGRVVFTTAWTAWSTALSEASRISPRSLLAVLLVARRHGRTPLIDTAIQTVLDAK